MFLYGYESEPDNPQHGTPDSAEWWRSIAQGLGVKLYASNHALKLGLEALEGTSAIDVLEVMAIMREAIGDRRS